MLKQVISKRPLVLVTLLTLAVALLVVGANSAYATHGGGPLYETDFGASPPAEVNIPMLLPEWTDGDGGNGDCSTQNVGGGEMALEVRDGCWAYVTFDTEGHQFLRVDYDWGYHTGGRSGDHGDLVVEWRSPAGVGGWTAGNMHELLPKAKILPTVGAYFLIDLGATLPPDIDIRFLGATPSDQDKAWVDNVLVYSSDGFLPLGTVTYTQGYYGGPDGEALTCQILAGMYWEHYDEIYDILKDLYGVDTGDIESDPLLCLFLVGEYGPGKDYGYIPAGKLDPYPNNNLAAQKITLLLNLNLDVIYGTWGEPEVDFRPIMEDYNINIDPVLGAAVWGDVYPLEETWAGVDERLGYCADPGGLPSYPNLCPGGAEGWLTPLGELVRALDDYDDGAGTTGTTVEDIMIAACDLLEFGYATIDVHGETITRLDMEKLLSLINESYDEGGRPTGFVTNGDPD